MATRSSDMTTSTVHGTAIRLDGKGVLIQGASGSGKSRLALALLADAGCWPLERMDDTRPSIEPVNRPTALIGDDQLALEKKESRLLARAPDSLAGLIEMRGIGLLTMPWCEAAPLDLVVELLPIDAIKRLPDPEEAAFGEISLPKVTVPIGDLAQQKLMVGAALRIFGGP